MVKLSRKIRIYIYFTFRREIKEKLGMRFNGYRCELRYLSKYGVIEIRIYIYRIKFVSLYKIINLF